MRQVIILQSVDIFHQVAVNVTGDKKQFYMRDDGCNLEILALFDKL